MEVKLLGSFHKEGTLIWISLNYIHHCVLTQSSFKYTGVLLKLGAVPVN